MKQLIKINNSELSFRLKLNYNNVYSRLKMLLGKNASIFADISTKSTNTSWYSNDDAEYSKLSEASEVEAPIITQLIEKKITQITKELKNSPELAPYADDIMEIPDLSFIFYRKNGDEYLFVLTAWGCKFAHTGPNDPSNGIIRRLTKKYDFNENLGEVPSEKSNSGIPDDTHNNSSSNPLFTNTDKFEDLKDTEHFERYACVYGPPPPSNDFESVTKSKKLQHVVLRVLDQNNNPVSGESVVINTIDGQLFKESNDNGLIEIGNLPCASQFTISFPKIKSINERSFEVEPKVEMYDAHIKKLVKYSPIVFVEDQNGNTVQNHDIKIMIAGQETIYNTGEDGMIQLPAMLDGQKFIAIDTTNYANTEEFDITPVKAKAPYRFKIKRPEKIKVGITILDKLRKPIPGAIIDIELGNMPCQQITGADGRAEFPINVFTDGIIPITIKPKNKSKIKHELNFNHEVTEYAVQIKDKNSVSGIDWKWLGILPLLALLGWGGYKLLDNTPTWEELNKGVVLIKSEEVFTVSTGLPENTGYSTLYFNYDANNRKIMNATFDRKSATYTYAWGTGFFISKDGLIATNRHVAAPIAPVDDIVSLIKEFFLSHQVKYEQKAQEFQKILNKYSNTRGNSQKNEAILDAVQDSLDIYRNMSRYYDQILKLSNYKVNTTCNTYAAFDNSMIKTIDDQAFHPCTCLAFGEPGDVRSNDVAIIQLNEKEKIVPKDAYIFKVPKKDPFADNKENNEDYEVWVLGYNAGAALAGTDVGIHPQHFKGNISSTNEKYRVQYNMGIIGGSSGSPVLNKDRELVAVNNSGFGDTNINYGVRITYLNELLEKIDEKRNITKK